MNTCLHESFYGDKCADCGADLVAVIRDQQERIASLEQWRDCYLKRVATWEIESNRPAVTDEQIEHVQRICVSWFFNCGPKDVRNQQIRFALTPTDTKTCIMCDQEAGAFEPLCDDCAEEEAQDI